MGVAEKKMIGKVSVVLAKQANSCLSVRTDQGRGRCGEPLEAELVILLGFGRFKYFARLFEIGLAMEIQKPDEA